MLFTDLSYLRLGNYCAAYSSYAKIIVGIIMRYKRELLSRLW